MPHHHASHHANQQHHDAQKNGDSWTERTARDDPKERSDDYQRPMYHQAFKHAHNTSMGAASHIVHMLGVFVPVVAGELIESPKQYKKVVRLASIGTALAYEGLHVYNEMKRRHEQEMKLAECHNRLEQCER